MLKKLIKELPSLIPLEDGGNKSVSPACSHTRSHNTSGNEHNQEPAKTNLKDNNVNAENSIAVVKDSKIADIRDNKNKIEPQEKKGYSRNVMHTHAELMSRSVGEKTFFRLLFEELGKAQNFFGQAQLEFKIREERLKAGVKIVKKPHPFMVDEKWSFLAKSVYNLYKDLLLLETYAIMAYCSFSKILKKHDKVTGYATRKAFMENVVNKTNFTTYPQIASMIQRTELLYEEVSKNLRTKGKENLGEDERLFINMIHRLNLQIVNKAEPDCVVKKERKALQSLIGKNFSPDQMNSPTGYKMTDSIRNLVVENEKTLNETPSCLSDEQEAKVTNTHEQTEPKSETESEGKNISMKREAPIHNPKIKSKKHRLE